MGNQVRLRTCWALIKKISFKRLFTMSPQQNGFSILLCFREMVNVLAVPGPKGNWVYATLLGSVSGVARCTDGRCRAGWRWVQGMWAGPRVLYWASTFSTQQLVTDACGVNKTGGYKVIHTRLPSHDKSAIWWIMNKLLNSHDQLRFGDNTIFVESDECYKCGCGVGLAANSQA